MPAKIDLLGQRFGRLVVTAPAASTPGRNSFTRWECRCDCGNTLVTYTNGLRSGHARSCGCLQRDTAANGKTKHGCFNTPEHKAWSAMRSRCRDPGNSSYPYYGAKGVSVCREWEDFETFLRDVGPRPPNTTLDRLDPYGNYEPGNCRWATRTEQDNNKRSSVRVTFEGRTMTYAQWGRELGTSPSILRRRFLKYKTLHPITRTKESYRAKQDRATTGG